MPLVFCNMGGNAQKLGCRLQIQTQNATSKSEFVRKTLGISFEIRAGTDSDTPRSRERRIGGKNDDNSRTQPSPLWWSGARSPSTP
jgi:hypothetical protein